MKIIALIPARGGSKRLPGKNIRLLGNKPLIAWTIEAALQSGVCDDILVSTDDEAIAAVARTYGASVPYLRPSELSSDTATSIEVALHALEVYEAQHGSVDGLLLLQPTSPFRSSSSIREAILKWSDDEAHRPVVSVSPASSHPAWCFRISSTSMEPFLGWETMRSRSQDLDEAWTLNGAIYLISPADLRSARSFLTPNTRPLVIESAREAVDIDTPEDWSAAEALL